MNVVGVKVRGERHLRSHRVCGRRLGFLCRRIAKTVHAARPVRDNCFVQAGAAPETIRVLLADERPLFANAVQTMLATHPRFELIGVASDGEEAIDLASELSPDVVLIDADLRDLDGLEVTRRICEDSAPRMVLLTGGDADFDAVEAHDAGAGACLPKPRLAADLLDTLEFTALLLDAADALPQQP